MQAVKSTFFFIFGCICTYYLPNFDCYILYFLPRSRCFSCDNNIHINASSIRISSCLLDRYLDQIDSFLNILLFYSIWKFHLGKGLTQPYQWLKLPRRSCNSLSIGPHPPHLDICLDKPIRSLQRYHRIHILPCIRDILSQSISRKYSLPKNLITNLLMNLTLLEIRVIWYIKI